MNYTKGGWINRNRIAGHGEPLLFTVPLAGSSPHATIRDSSVAAGVAWHEKFLRTVSQRYASAPYAQGGRPFVPGLSIIDVMMWNGPEQIREEHLTSYTLS